MSNAKTFIKNGLIMSAAALIIRTASMGFNVYMSQKLGAQGMGLYSLISAVYRFAMTFSLSGIGLAAARLTAEEFAVKSGSGAKSAVVRCSVYALIFSLSAATALLVSADLIAEKMLSDARCALSIRILAVSLPFLSVSAVFDGYFNAKRCVKKTAASLILEQTVRMTAATVLIELFLPADIKYACAGVSAGITLSEAASFLYMLVCFLRCGRADTADPSPPSKNQNRRMLAIAVPIAVSSYLRSGLSTLREILIPSGLKKYGGSYEKALASYGVVQGMTMPVLMFFAVFLGSFADLLMPEMARYYRQGHKVSIQRNAARALRVTLIFSMISAAMLTAFSREIGLMFYNSEEASAYIRVLAPLTVVMYLDNMVDSVLKGVNEQLANVRYNILDGALSLALICLLLPRFGIGGYLAVIFISEIFNLTLSLRRMLKVTGMRFCVKEWVLLPAASAALAALMSRLPAVITGADVMGVLPSILSAFAGVCVYYLLLRAFDAVHENELRSALATVINK